nr:TolC family protein [uncultured Holophaga sp.]
MPTSRRRVLYLGLSAAIPVLASPSPASPAPHPDPVLDSLIQETLDRNPDLARSHALDLAERERIPQARALPDPTLALGLQNDGFKSIQVGKMSSSYYQIMVTQPLPWPGKRDLKADIARLGAEGQAAATDRTRLTLIADLKRAYYGLLLVRGQQELLRQQQQLWDRAAEITRVRYEVGQGTQADLLRAQVEQNRLKQAAVGLEGEAWSRLTQLNRLRALPPETPLATPSHLVDLQPEPRGIDWVARAESESPELQEARLAARQAGRSLDLAKRNRFPDMAVTAGYMPRGSLDPMWQVGFSLSIPLWSGQKQHRAIAEQERRHQAGTAGVESLRQTLSQRIREREAQLESARSSLKIFREGLLIQDEASYQAALAQYQSGRSPFLGVLEALNGWIADQGALLQTLAQVLALQIAQEEFNLNGTPSITAPSLRPAAMGMGGSSSTSSAKPAASPAGESASGMAAM